MTNLSDLFPAGAGKQVSFVADGSISAAGKPVLLTAAGKVEPVVIAASDPVGIGTPVVFEAASTEYIAATFDSNENKVVIAYRDSGNSDYGTAIVGTVSGTAISFGTAVVYNSGTTDFVSCTFDSDANKVVIAYRDVGAGSPFPGTAIVGTVSGTAISFGTEVEFASVSAAGTASTFDSSNNKVVIAYRNATTSNHGTAVVGTVSGTSISFGTPVEFNAANTNLISATFDSSNNKVVISYQDIGNAYSGTSIVGTVSGTSISFGTEGTFNGQSSMIGSCFDTTANKVVVTYQDGTNSDYGTSNVGTVSGTSISFGADGVFESAATANTFCAYDSGVDRTTIVYQDSGNSNYGTVVNGAVSGTSISFTAAAVFSSATTTYISCAYDSNAGKVVGAYWNGSAGTSVVLSGGATNLTASNLLGISDAAISDTASGNITVKGGIAVNGLSSLTPGTDSYAQGDGTISTSSSGDAVKLGRALSATSIDLEYQS